MNGILPDSSAWIDLFNAKAVNSQKDKLIQLLANKSPLWTCPPVYQEVLQGTRDGQPFIIARRRLRQCWRGRIGTYQAAEYAAEIYRTLRKRGVTIRKANDCLIAAYCLLNDLALLHHDRDFDPIEKHFGLQVVR
jgi:predicted nucleic acid-binding protein